LRRQETRPSGGACQRLTLTGHLCVRTTGTNSNHRIRVECSCRGRAQSRSILQEQRAGRDRLFGRACRAMTIRRRMQRGQGGGSGRLN
jgi:hypothetical protein